MDITVDCLNFCGNKSSKGSWRNSVSFCVLAADTNCRHGCLVSSTLIKHCHSPKTMETRAVLLSCSLSSIAVLKMEESERSEGCHC